MSGMARPETHTRRPGVVLAVVCAAAFMGVLDVAIVNVALPSIQRDMGVSQGTLQWVVTAYGLLFGGFLLLGGRLGDLVGRRRIFVAGLVLFALSSLGAGLAPSLGVLIVARGLQGLGAALTAPSALSILTTTFPEGPKRNRALGVWGAVAGSGATAGVIAGGLLTSGPGWEWIFLVNVPIGLGLAALAVALVPESRRETEERRFDAAGAASVTAGLLLLVYGVNRTLDHGWASPETLLPLTGAAALLVAFVAIERRSPAPLVPFGVLRRSTVPAAGAIGALGFGAFFPLTVLTTLYMQQVLGYSPLEAGVAFLAMSLSSLLASAVVGGRLVGRFSVRPVLLTGGSLLGAALVALARVPAEGSYLDLLPGFLMAGLGLGSSVVAVQVAAFTGIEPRAAGLVSGLVNTTNMVGGAIGTSIVLTVAAARTGDLLATAGPGGVALGPALVEGFRWGYLTGIVLAFAGVLLALSLPRRNHAVPAAVSHGPAESPDRLKEEVA